MADEKKPTDPYATLFAVSGGVGEETRARLRRDAAAYIMPSAAALVAAARLAAPERLGVTVAHAARLQADVIRCMRPAVEGLRAVGAVVAQFRRDAEAAIEAMRRRFAEMSDEEREEWRRAIEDAPLEPVDVNAPGVV